MPAVYNQRKRYAAEYRAKPGYKEKVSIQAKKYRESEHGQAVLRTYREKIKIYRKVYMKTYRSKPEFAERKLIYEKRYRNSEKGKATIKTNYERNKEHRKEYHREYSKQWGRTAVGKASNKKGRDKYYYKNLEASRKRGREWYYKRKQNVEYRIHDAVSSNIYDALKDQKNGRSWETLVGYSLRKLMLHLATLFQPGMNWDNFGKWHIDHARPRSSFHFSSAEDPEFKKCWALENLQPLWAEENMKKGNHILD